MKIKYYAWFLFFAFTLTNCNKDIYDPTLPSVETGDYEESHRLIGHIQYIGSAPIIEYGHCWTLEDEKPKITDDRTTIILNIDSESLKDGVPITSYLSPYPFIPYEQYKTRAYAVTANDEVVYGEDLNFIISKEYPVLITGQSVARVGCTETTANLRWQGLIDVSGDFTVREVGYCWERLSITDDPLLENSQHVSEDDLEFTIGTTKYIEVVITNLTLLTDYVINMYAIIDPGNGQVRDTIYGDLQNIFAEDFGCPNSMFTISNNNCNAPCTVTFTVSNPQMDMQYHWDFGDGTTITTANTNVENTYEQSGEYTASLTVTDNVSIENTAQQTITITDPPIADFELLNIMNNSCTASCEIMIQNNSTNATSYFWDYGDGMTSDNDSLEHTHEYESAGVYNLRLFAYNGVSQDSREITVNVLEPPIADFEINLGTGDCFINQSVQFSSLNINPDNTYEWDFGDGLSYTGPVVNHTYTGYSLYYVMLTVTDINGVSVSQTQTINIEDVNFVCGSTFVDLRDGNTYSTVSIEVDGGCQCWMQENLQYGESETLDELEVVFGTTYSPATMRENPCPCGWHVSTDEEWLQVELSLGMSEDDLLESDLRGQNMYVGNKLLAFEECPLAASYCSISKIDLVRTVEFANTIQASYWSPTENSNLTRRVFIQEDPFINGNEYGMGVVRGEDFWNWIRYSIRCVQNNCN